MLDVISTIGGVVGALFAAALALACAAAALGALVAATFWAYTLPTRLREYRDRRAQARVAHWGEWFADGPGLQALERIHAGGRPHRRRTARAGSGGGAP